jgi:hypothetical protein
MSSENTLSDYAKQFVGFLYNSNLHLEDLEDFVQSRDLKQAKKFSRYLFQHKTFYDRLYHEFRLCVRQAKANIAKHSNYDEILFNEHKWSEIANNDFFAVINVKLLEILQYLENGLIEKTGKGFEIVLGYDYTPKKNRFLNTHKQGKAIDITFDNYRQDKMFLADILEKSGLNYYLGLFTDYAHVSISSTEPCIQDIESKKVSRSCHENFNS